MEGQPPTGGRSHLPWKQVPKFTPGVTNVDEYSQRLKCLKELWPAEHVQHLAPRAALMVEGAAFHKISRIAPDKLRSADGAQLLVETLGGSWGKTAVAEKYHYLEQAMFVVSQKADESNDSYISRHDAAFEELLARKVSIEEIRAYILLRHSQLSPEDKKKVVVEAKGDLKYQDTIKSVRLLGSKFFTDFQQRGASSKGTERTKVHDVNAAMEEEPKEELFATEGDETDEDILMMFRDMGDEDAAYVTEFEDRRRSKSQRLHQCSRRTLRHDSACGKKPRPRPVDISRRKAKGPRELRRRRARQLRAMGIAESR